MPFKLIAVAAVLAFSPLAAIAQCSGDHNREQASSCVQGYVWDSDAQACVEVVSG